MKQMKGGSWLGWYSGSPDMAAVPWRFRPLLSMCCAGNHHCLPLPPRLRQATRACAVAVAIPAGLAPTSAPLAGLRPDHRPLCGHPRSLACLHATTSGALVGFVLFLFVFLSGAVPYGCSPGARCRPAGVTASGAPPIGARRDCRVGPAYARVLLCIGTPQHIQHHSLQCRVHRP